MTSRGSKKSIISATELDSSSPQSTRIATGRGKRTAKDASLQDTPREKRSRVRASAVESDVERPSHKPESSSNPKKLTTTANARPTTKRKDKGSTDQASRGSEDPQTETVKNNVVNSQTTKKEKESSKKHAEMTPLAVRTPSTLLKIGAHVSAAGGVHNAVTNAVHIGGNAFALFLKSQRKWANPDIKPEAREQFGELCKAQKYDESKHIVPHGSYLVNLCALDKEKADQAYAGFLDDLQRCESIGVKLYNFHPGNTNGHPRAEALARLAKQLNRAHKATSSVVTLLENMASGRDRKGNTVGGAFEDLREVIDQVEDKTRVGVCIDTCHAFASGYDLRTRSAFEETFAEFDKVIGAEYLRAFHVNDSKAPLGAKRDLHANVGTGFLGLRAFHALCNMERFHGVPMILETPIDHKDDNGKSVEDKQVWAREIKLLESLAGMDVESEEFRSLEKDLSERGSSERERLQGQADRKEAKNAKQKSGLKRSKKQKQSKNDSDSEGNESCSSCS